MELRRISLCLAFFVLAVISQCSEARLHNVHRRDAQADPEPYTGDYDEQADAAAFDDETQNDAEGDDEDEDVNATILNSGEEFKVGIGKAVRLPCTVNPSPKVNENVAFKWSRDGRDYFIGSIRMEAPARLHIDEETKTDLVITDLQTADSGKYRCDIMKEATKNGEAQKAVFVEHTLRVEAPPKIIEISATNRGQVEEGSEVHIVCAVSGSPPPKIIWSKEDASGENHALSENDAIFSPNSLTIKSVKREHAGKYICLADNRVANPDVGSIKLQVLGKPRVHVHKTIVNSALNVEAILQCTAHEEPPALISWYKDGNLIERDSAQYRITISGQHSNLTVTPTSDAEFGTFTCEAENNYGKHSRSIQLVQTPVVEHLDVDGPKLSWTVHSHQPLRTMQLHLREMNQDASSARTITVPVPEASGHEYPVEYEIKEDLEPGRYEVQVHVQNDFDWGQAEPAVVEIETHPQYIQHASVFRGAAHSTRTETALLASVIMYLFVRML